MIATSKSNVSLSRRIWAHIKLADPVTWISPSLMLLFGAFASGQATGFQPANVRDWGIVALGALMTGPLGTGFSQSVNDYFDRDLDAINDPTRPIPSGEVTLAEARFNWIFLGLATLLVSFVFGKPTIVLLALVGLVLSYVYSAPPLKLKKNYWLGPPAVGLGYVSMSWIAGHIIFGPLTWPSATIAIIHGLLATGLLFLNDIKSTKGDQQHGLSSLMVALGVKPALLVSFGVINVSELMLMILMVVWDYVLMAGFVLVALVVPIYSQVKLYREPSHQNFLRYILASNGFMVAIQCMSALIVGGYFGGYFGSG